MKIIIAGAGDVGFHLAEHLVSENQDITLIDTDEDILDYVSSQIDVLTIKGNAASIEVLKDAQVEKANLVLAMTTSETTNLVTASLAKKLGAKRTIARVKSMEYLNKKPTEIFNELGVNILISPSHLTSLEIARLVKRASFTDVFDFEDGKFTLVGATLSETSPLNDIKISEWPNLDGHSEKIRPVALLRSKETIIPAPNTVLRQGDHVYFITNKSKLSALSKFIGHDEKIIKRITIAGGSRLAYETALLLENDFKVTLVEKDKTRCKILATELENTIILQGDPTNASLLKDIGIGRADAFLALTTNSEANIIASLSAKSNGVYKTVAHVDNKEYAYISQDIGIDTLINKKLIAANNVLRYVRKGHVEAITSLQGVDAEVIEYVIERDNHVVRKPIGSLDLPETAKIGGVIRGENTIVPDDNFVLQIEDKVIIFAMPDAISKLENVFR